LVTIGAGALPLPTKQPPRLKPATTKTNASATFFMTSPNLYASQPGIYLLSELQSPVQRQGLAWERHGISQSSSKIAAGCGFAAT
jgi:hypothetical protein